MLPWKENQNVTLQKVGFVDNAAGNYMFEVIMIFGCPLAPTTKSDFVGEHAGNQHISVSRCTKSTFQSLQKSEFVGEHAGN